MAIPQASLLSVRELRALLRSAKTAFAPDHVAQSLKDWRTMVVEKEAPELARTLKDLIDAARTRLHDEGIEPVSNGRRGQTSVPKRERTRASNLSLLLRFYGMALLFSGRQDEAREVATEAIGWARAGKDLREESHVWHTVGHIHQFSGRLVDEEGALEQAMKCAQELGDPLLIVRQMLEFIAALIAHDKQTSAIPLIEEGFALVETIPEEHHSQIVRKLLTQKGRVSALQKNEREAIGTFREALRLSDENLDPYGHVAILTQLGMAYAGLGDYQQSIEYQREMVRVAEAHDMRIACAWGLFRIGESYTSLGDPENAEKAFALALESSPASALQPRLHILGKRAQICLNQERIEEGIAHCHQVLESLPERESPFLTIFVLLTLGQLEEKRGNLFDAERALRRAIELGKETDTADRSSNVNVFLSKVLIRQGRTAEAEELLIQTSESTIRTMADRRAVSDAYELLANLTEERGEFREALLHTKKHQEHASQIVARATEEAVHKARVLAEVELYEREALYERERRRQMERELAEAIVSIDKKKLTIEKVEKQLHKTLSFLASEKANEVVGTLRNVLLGIDSEEEEHAFHYIRSIDNEFSLRLRERWPNLTRKQERLCGLIRAGLTSQEIIKLLDISYETLRTQRKRLRKALELQSGEGLETVIGEV